MGAVAAIKFKGGELWHIHFSGTDPGAVTIWFDSYAVSFFFY